MGVCLHIYVCVHVCSAHSGQRAYPALRIWGKSCHEGSGNQTWVLCNSNKYLTQGSSRQPQVVYIIFLS